MQGPMKRAVSNRVAVTGIGVITSIGNDLFSFRKALFEGKNGVGPVTIFDTSDFPCRLGAQVRDDYLGASFSPQEIRRISRCDLLGLTAADEALFNSLLDLDECNKDRTGVVLGGGAGGMLSWERFRRGLWSGEKRPRPSPLLASAPCTLTDLIARRYELGGYRATITTACSSSATSIGYASDLIRSGRQDIVVTGGSEALSELTFAGFSSLRVMDPEACRPFDKNRRGLSLGEGAAVLVLENYDLALSRGAVIYAEVMGYAINADAFHMTAPDPEAKGVCSVMARALENAQVEPGQVDYINAHGTGTKANDAMETKAIKEVFGEEQARALAISSTKSMVGHCLGAAGAVETVATILALTEQLVPPTVNLEVPDPDCDLDYVPTSAREKKIRFALNNSFAFGGNNTSLVLGKV